MAEAATQHHGKPTTPKTAKSQNATTLANPVASTPSAQDLSLLLRVDRATGFVAVQDFLKAFPECLEEFVAAHVSAEDLERLLIRKTHRTVDFFTDFKGPTGCQPPPQEVATGAGSASVAAGAASAVATAAAAAAAALGTDYGVGRGGDGGLDRDLSGSAAAAATTTTSATQHLTRSLAQNKRLSLSRWKFCVHADKRKMLQQLTREITDGHNKVRVLVELSDCIANAVNAHDYHLYFLNDAKDMLTLYVPGDQVVDSGRPFGGAGADVATKWAVQSGTTVAAFVAYTQKTLLVKRLDTGIDPRFPDGVGNSDKDADRTISVLCQPIFQSDGELIGVLELMRTCEDAKAEAAQEEIHTQEFRLQDLVFAEEDEEISSSYLVWGGIAMYYAEMYVGLRKMRNLNDFLLDVIKSLFKDISTDAVVARIMAYAKQLVDADRASLFLVDAKQEELVATVFDQGDEELSREIRFPKDKGIAGYVASTGETLNIADAYSDPRFNRDVDALTGYRTRSVLCMPIVTRDKVIGVVQLVNKRDQSFSKKDEAGFQVFAVYCGLALHNAKLYDKLWKSEQRYKVASEIMAYHSKCSDAEVSQIRRLETRPVSLEGDFQRFDFFGWHLDADVKVQCILDMFVELFKLPGAARRPTPSDADLKPFAGEPDEAIPLRGHERWSSQSQGSSRIYVDHDQILPFLLTVRKNYRHIPYHNFSHAFEVARAMYCLLKARHRFSMLEAVGLFVACLCHDVDHRGKTNSYMVKSASPLAAMYSTSTMEHHHFRHTVTILQQDGHNIFARLQPTEYKEVLRVIKHCILATDLTQFFSNKPKLDAISKPGSFSWSEGSQRDLAMAVGMTACDLSSGYTVWEGSQELASKIMDEFWEQGDEEKRRGLTKAEQIEPILDRRQQENLPLLEVQFLSNVCLPCFVSLSQVIPEAQEMVDGARTNLEKWREMAHPDKTTGNPDKTPANANPE